MNFLALCNRVKLECGVSGAAMATTVGQAESLARLVAWVNTAWVDIQSAHDNWGWMRATATFPTVAGQAIYTPAQCGLTDFGAWDRDSFRSYNTAAGINAEMLLTYVDYFYWRDVYQVGTTRSQASQPIVMTLTPERHVGLGPVPAAGYTVLGDYYRVPTEMALNDDLPALPTQFHMLIVYGAMMHYGAFEAAPEVYQRGQSEFNKMMRRLAMQRLPQILLPGALA